VERSIEMDPIGKSRKFKIAVFIGPNWVGLALTLLPQRWDQSVHETLCCGRYSEHGTVYRVQSVEYAKVMMLPTGS
jgi:hypothetical protein